MKKNLLIIVSITLIFQACYKDPDFTNFDYDTYNRVVGPSGGTINFYSNYDDDSKNDVLVRFDVPEGALDSVMVFNMYQFEEYELVLQMHQGFSNIGSKFLYFVPFYESQGYHEHSQLDISYHLSVEFNRPVTVTYNFLNEGLLQNAENWQQAELYSDYYKRTNRGYRLYRIKIPKLDEWGENNNIYVNWNSQGYPNGYDETGLKYIVSGLWSVSDDFGKGETSLDNWQEVTDFDLNVAENSVSFEIYNTDYIYVLSRKLQIDVSDIPIHILNGINILGLNADIKRAAIDGNFYNIYLSDNRYVTFSKRGDFQSITDDDYRLSLLGPEITAVLNSKYPTSSIKKIKYTDYLDYQLYEISLTNGIKAYFSGDGTFMYDSRYGVDSSEIPAEILSYIQQNFPGDLITNITTSEVGFLDNTFSYYTIYLSSNIKVYFHSDYGWLKTQYYALLPEDLPDEIIEYFNANYPNPDFIEINHNVSPDGEEYETFLIDDKYFLFNELYEVQQIEIGSLEEDDLPLPISTFINTHFPNRELTDIFYYYYDYASDGIDEGYEIYFADMLDIVFDPDGTIVELYGKEKAHLPLPIRNVFETLFSEDTLLSCTFSRDGLSYPNPVGGTYFYNWELILSSNLLVGLDMTGNVVFTADYNIQKKKSEAVESPKESTLRKKRIEIHEKFKKLKK